VISDREIMRDKVFPTGNSSVPELTQLLGSIDLPDLETLGNGGLDQISLKGGATKQPTVTFSSIEKLGQEGKAFLSSCAYSSMSRHLASIDSSMSQALRAGWLSDGEVESVIERLGNVKNAADAYKLEQFVCSIAKDPEQKVPPKLTITSTDREAVTKSIVKISDF
jgi:hypothetical protein